MQPKPPILPGPRRYEFQFPRTDTLVLVEEFAGRVVVRTTRDSFSDQAKAYFLRELAAEGFIPDDSRWSDGRRVRWVVDTSWVQPGSILPARIRRLAIPALILAAGAWAGIVAILAVHGR